MRTRAAACLLTACLLAGCGGWSGCSSQPRGSHPYAPAREAARDPARAQELTMRATDLLESAPERAEALLREALSADLWHGPAHNNLGVLLLERGDLYGAAGEFEWARKLMPGHPDPRMNLALALERAGRHADAEAGYRSALEVRPGHAPSQQALARLIVRERLPANDLPDLLRDIALHGETEEWRTWARGQMTRVD